MNNIYYVYIYLDPRKSGFFKYDKYEFNYEPFYIGKGKYKRYKDISHRNRYFKNKISKIKKNGFEPIILKLKDNLSEKISFEFESYMIRIIGRKDLNIGPLINLTNGGEGIDTREKNKEYIIKNFDKIKNEFISRKYILLSKKEDYINCYTKLKCICPNGHHYLTTWNNFHQGYNCYKCRKKNFNEIEKEFNSRGFELLTKDEEYVNKNTILKYICNKGHVQELSWKNFSRSKGCNLCFIELNSKRQRKNFNDIKKEFVSKKCKLITKEEEYINSKTKLRYICNNGHLTEKTFSNFKANKYICKKCFIEKINKNKKKF